MKKIYKYEINESIAAQAAMNCLKNRNNHKQLNETSEFDARFEFRKDLRELASPAAKKAYMIIRKQYGDSMWRQLCMDDCDEQGLIEMLNMYAEDGLKPQQIVNKIMDVQEQEETDYTNDEIPSPNFSYRMSFMVWAMREIIPHLREISQVCAQADPTELKHAVMKILKTRDTGIPETPRSCKEWANENYDWVEMELNDEYDAYQEKWSKPFNISASIEETPYTPSEQEEHPEDYGRLQSQLANAWDEGMEDDEDDYVPYKNTFDETHNDIVDNLISAVEHYFDTDDDVSGFNHYDYTEDQIGKAVEKVLDKYGDFPSSNNFNKCYAWTKKHAEELMKILETGSLENPYEGHPEFDFSEQEEMEVTDAKHALTQLAAELLHYDDGDLDELYYAISDIIESEGYSPEPDEYEMWIEEHVNEIEDLIM